MKKIILGLVVLGVLSVGYAKNYLVTCVGCHGVHFEKKALGVSKVVKDLNETEIVTSLKGYKNGTYGGPMKGVMKGQLRDFNDSIIEDVAKQIKSKK